MSNTFQTGQAVSARRRYDEEAVIGTVIEYRGLVRDEHRWLIIQDGQSVPSVWPESALTATTRTPGAHAAVEEPLAPAVDPEHHAERYDPELLPEEPEMLPRSEWTGPSGHNRWDPDCTENADFGHMDRYARCVICKPLQPIESDVPDVEEPLTVTTTAPEEDVPHGQLTTRSTPYITRLHKDDVEADDGVIRGMLYDRTINPHADGSTIPESRRKIEADLIEETTSTPEARLDITRTALYAVLVEDMRFPDPLVDQIMSLFDRGVALAKAIGR